MDNYKSYLSLLINKKWSALFIGYIIGLIILLIQIWLPHALNYLFIIRDPDPEINLINLPNIKDYQATNPNLNDYIKWDSMGDFKIILDNKILPKSDQYGYILSAKTYLNYEKEIN